MMNKQERLENRLQPKIAEFREERQTLILSTLSTDGFPHISYAPFVRLEDGYYILISEVAEHTQNLLVNKNLSFMLLEDELNSKQIFARHRLTYKANAEVIARESESWSQAIPALEARFGEIITNLSGLSDFRLFRIEPQIGRYVKGFGQAYTVNGNDDIDFVHLEQGHQQVKKEVEAQ
ncbi:heme utilization protein HutZ [Moritella viscosa]|uniref:heme utilization protein HutZ n=1 Tax=Moritella viscosa TaxID=80854 RepID=UPI000AD1E24D|nr:heme utilization protein HutZ [Moritella viscosa]